MKNSKTLLRSWRGQHAESGLPEVRRAYVITNETVRTALIHNLRPSGLNRIGLAGSSGPRFRLAVGRLYWMAVASKFLDCAHATAPSINAHIKCGICYPASRLHRLLNMAHKKRTALVAQRQRKQTLPQRAVGKFANAFRICSSPCWGQDFGWRASSTLYTLGSAAQVNFRTCPSAPPSPATQT